MKLTDLLRRTAEANPQAATLHSIADKAEELVEKRYSVRRMLREMESFAHDTEAMRLTVDALRQHWNSGTTSPIWLWLPVHRKILPIAT